MMNLTDKMKKIMDELDEDMPEDERKEDDKDNDLPPFFDDEIEVGDNDG